MIERFILILPIKIKLRKMKTNCQHTWIFECGGTKGDRFLTRTYTVNKCTKCQKEKVETSKELYIGFDTSLVFNHTEIIL